MDDVDPLLAWVKSKSIDDLESYLRRGRKFERIPLPELKTLWIAAYRAHLNANLDPAAGQEANDLEAEFRLRKADPPFEEVLADFRDFQERNQEALDKLLSNPIRRKLANDAILRDLEEFISQLEGRATN